MSDHFPNAGGYTTSDESDGDTAVEETAPAKDVAANVSESDPESVGDEDKPRAEQTDPSTPVASDSGRVVGAVQPSYEADEDGYVGVDPVYRNASDHKRRPAVGEGEDAKVPDAPADDDNE